MRLGIDPKLDIVFKKAFGREESAPLLSNLLQAVLSLRKPITELKIVVAQTDKETPEDKQVVGDIKARDQGNRQFHLEMQLQVPWFFLKRILYYWGKFYTQQLREGEWYQTLRPTYSICFVNEVLVRGVADYHLVFTLRERNHEVVFSKDLEVHLIELPKFSKRVEELTSPLERWCYFLRHGAELDLDNLPATLDVPEIRKVMEVLTVWTKEEREREAYEQRVKFQRDQGSLLFDATERGLEKGLKQGLEQGLEKGELVGQVRILQEILKQPQTPQKELSALPLGDLAALLGQLRKQLLPNGV